jgi:Phage tail-collar fibre protein
MTTQITQAGVTLATAATSSGGTKININSFKVGPTIIQPVPNDPTTDITDSVYIGSASQMQYAVVDNNTIEYIITLDETVGDFSVGRIGLYHDNGDGTRTLFSITALDAPNPDYKFNTSGNQVGDRLKYAIYLAITNFSRIANFSISLLPLLSVPETSTELTLPDPLHVAFNTSQVMKHSVARIPAIAYRETASQGRPVPAWLMTSERFIPGKGEGIIPLDQSRFDSGAPIGTVVGLDSTNQKIIKGEPATNINIVGIRSSAEEITNYGIYVDPVNQYNPMQKLFVGTGLNAGKLTTIANNWPVGYAIGPVSTQNASGYLCWIDFTIGTFGGSPVGPPGPAGPPGPQGPSGGAGLFTPACYLKLIGTNLVLTPYNGNLIIINQTLQRVPAAGVALPPTGLTANTLYYIYAYMVGAAITLEASTTGHVTSSIDGVEIKSGDQSRTLVGMAYTITGTPGAIWTDAAPSTAGPGEGNSISSGYTIGPLYVLSWFNQRPKSSNTWFTVRNRTASPDFFEIATSMRNYFLTWGFREVEYSTSGVQVNYTPAGVATAMGFDGGSYERFGTSSVLHGSGGGISQGNVIGIYGRKRLSEGQHFGTLLGLKAGSSSGGQAPWWNLSISTNAHPGERGGGGIDSPCNLMITVMG